MKMPTPPNAILFTYITEARRAEEALRESERRYSALFANKINGVAHCRVITDELGVPGDYRILQVNDAYQRIIGVKRDDIEGRRVTEVFPDIKEYAFDYIGTYGRIALEGGEIKFEEYFEATRQYLSIHAYSPLPGEFTAIFTDVTERRRAEEWLLESQMRMATFSAATFEGIIESEAGRIVDCNNQIARMLGYQVGELKGMQIAALVAPEDLERVMANIRQGRESVVEHALLAKDGSRIVAEAHGRSLSPGSPTRLTAIRDITGRKEMESALQTTLQRFYDVLSSMYCGILLVTDEARVEFANQAFCECFALEDAPGDLVGLDPREIIRGAYLHPDEAVARIRETLELGRPVKGEEVALQGGRTCLRDFVHLEIEGKSYGRLWLHISSIRYSPPTLPPRVPNWGPGSASSCRRA
jgi:PAS domain S-box-containing protein